MMQIRSVGRVSAWVLAMALLGAGAAGAGPKKPGAGTAATANGTTFVTTYVTPPSPRDERVVPLGPATVREIIGAASWGRAAGAATALVVGGQVPDGARVESTRGAWVELSFGDGSVVRLGPESVLSLRGEHRQLMLHRGRVLVAADRMVGGVAVITRERAFLPEGTTYVVTAGAGPAVPLSAAVLEGALCACGIELEPLSTGAAGPAGPAVPAVGSSAAAGRPRRATPQVHADQVILPGEGWTLGSAAPPVVPAQIDLAGLLRGEPLIASFARPLPTLAKINELAREQARRILAGRNARLRREIFWKRPPRKALKVPALFGGQNSVTVQFE